MGCSGCCMLVCLGGGQAGYSAFKARQKRPLLMQGSAFFFAEKMLNLGLRISISSRVLPELTTER